jgi:hypothetical protein
LFWIKNNSLSPFTNIFNQRVKGLDDGFEAAEWDCEQLLDELIQLAEQRSNVCKQVATESPVFGPYFPILI